MVSNAIAFHFNSTKCIGTLCISVQYNSFVILFSATYQNPIAISNQPMIWRSDKRHQQIEDHKQSTIAIAHKNRIGFCVCAASEFSIGQHCHWWYIFGSMYFFTFYYGKRKEYTLQGAHSGFIKLNAHLRWWWVISARNEATNYELKYFQNHWELHKCKWWRAFWITLYIHVNGNRLRFIWFVCFSKWHFVKHIYIC